MVAKELDSREAGVLLQVLERFGEEAFVDLLNIRRICGMIPSQVSELLNGKRSHDTYGDLEEQVYKKNLPSAINNTGRILDENGKPIPHVELWRELAQELTLKTGIHHKSTRKGVERIDLIPKKNNHVSH